MDVRDPTLEQVREVIVDTLGLHDRAEALSADSLLLGGIPELDSFGVVELALALEARFGVDMDDAAFTADVFETLGTLAVFVESRRDHPSPVQQYLA